MVCNDKYWTDVIDHVIDINIDSLLDTLIEAALVNVLIDAVVVHTLTDAAVVHTLIDAAVINALINAAVVLALVDAAVVNLFLLCSGDTPLMRAARNHNGAIVDFLVSSKAKVHLADKVGDTALHIAIRARSKGK